LGTRGMGGVARVGRTNGQTICGAVGDARVGRTKGQTICGGPRWGRTGWEGLRGLGGLMARPFVVVPVGDARDGRTNGQTICGGVSELGIRRNGSVPNGDREDSPGLREPVRLMPRVNEINQSGALKGRERCPDVDGTGEMARPISSPVSPLCPFSPLCPLCPLSPLGSRRLCWRVPLVLESIPRGK